MGLAGVSVTNNPTLPPLAFAFSTAAFAPAMTASRLMASAHANRADAERRHGLVDERFGAAVQRLAHEQHVVGFEIGPQRGRDRRHAAREHARRFAAFPQTEPVFEHFEIRIVEARIHQARGLPGGGWRRPEV